MKREIILKNKNVIKTNILICVILIIGFTLTAIFSYRANYQSSIDNIEEVSSLSTEGIYYQLTTMFTKPVNISLTMAHDSLLVDHLSSGQEINDPTSFIETTKDYLNTYKEKYQFDSVFLVSSQTNNYYNFNGYDRKLIEGDIENNWYYELLQNNEDYDLNIDNDEVNSANNDITVFVNCKVIDHSNQLLGIVGIGIRLEHISELLASYENRYNVSAYLIDTNGYIQISTAYNGYKAKNWFTLYKQETIKDDILSWQQDNSNLELWSTDQNNNENFIVSRFIPELSWHLIVEQNTGELISTLKNQLYHSGLIIIAIIIIVLLIVTSVIKKFNKQITILLETQQGIFKKATEQLYDNIYEFNITKNSYAGNRTEQYFESLGAKNLTYNEGLKMVAKKQIKQEYQKDYIRIFNTENVIKEFESGNNNITYDFMITQDGTNYFWMRIDAYIFKSNEDNCIHMFTYRKNIDAHKKKELLANTDQMTDFYNKKTSETIIDSILTANQNQLYAFFIFDIDNFKQANDQYGHAFGDECIKKFTETIRNHFNQDTILGRLGGDEFMAFVNINDIDEVRIKAQELSNNLHIIYSDGIHHWQMSASIGISIAPANGLDFNALYRSSDQALYKTKQRGKNGYTIYE